jgi:hypothetical protein
MGSRGFLYVWIMGSQNVICLDYMGETDDFVILYSDTNQMKICLIICYQ